MPFRSVKSETSGRFLELQQFHRMLVANEANFRAPLEHPTLKGHFVVGLYAYIEFSMQQLIKAAVAHVNGMNIARQHLQPDLYAIVLEPEFMSASESSGEKKWLKRHEIVTGSSQTTICKMNDSLLNREIQNTRSSTMDLLFRLFAMKADVLVDDRTRRFVNEIGERRNAVAHGRESAAEVGGRFSAANLGDRLHSLELQTAHMIICFEDAATSKNFIKPSCKALYP